MSGLNILPSENLVLHQTYIGTFDERKHDRNLNFKFTKMNVRNYPETLKDTFLRQKFFQNQIILEAFRMVWL